MFLVGTNPATPIDRDCMAFEDYWDGLTKNPDAFEANYRDALSSSRRSTTTTERRRAFERALGINCLVTNVSAYPATRPKCIPAQHKGPNGTGYEILSALFQIAQPRAVLFHGADAAKFAKTKFRKELDIHADPYSQDVTVIPWYSNRPVHLFASVHLSGARRFGPQEMDQRMRAFAERIRAAFLASDSPWTPY